MATKVVVFLLCAAAVSAISGPDRENFTLVTLLAADCDECTKNNDFIYCDGGSGEISAGGVNVFNNTNATSGYCWPGTFGKLKYTSGEYDTFLDTTDVVITQDMSCDFAKLKYSQCVMSMLVVVILMAIGGIAAISLITCMCFWCGWCKCGFDTKCGGCHHCMTCGCCREDKKRKKKKKSERRMTNNPMIDPSRSMF